MRKHGGIVLFLMGLALPVGLASPVRAAEMEEDVVIEEGVYSEGIDLSGKSVKEAEELLNEYFENIAGSSLTVSFDNKQAVVTPGELGLSWDATAAAQEAGALGKSGQLIARYKAKADLKHSNISVDVNYTYDAKAVTDFVKKDIVSQDTEAIDASMTREDGEFKITEETNGLKTDAEATVTAITDVLDNELSDSMTVEAVVEVTVPEKTAEVLSQIEDKLGTYNTSYSSSSSARKTNIQVASERIDGSILMPGEALSVSDTILSRTAANGYKLAPQYVNGQSEDSYGGGVCQVSTTLYNAVIRAELQIDERHPHSMVVGYVPYSSDAAIAEGNKDFIFTNNTGYPVYIAASADGATLTFSIYGRETRDEGRTIEFISDTISYSTPSPTVKKDSSMYEGQERSEGSTHPAVHSTLTKVVYENGTEVSRETMNNDSYRGSGKTIYKGTKKKEKETKESKEKETTKETKKKEKETTKASKKEKETKKAKETTKETKKAKETTKETKKETTAEKKEEKEE